MGIHPAFRRFVIAGVGFSALFVVLAVIGLIWMIVATVGSAGQTPTHGNTTLFIIALLVVIGVGIYNMYKTYAEFQRATMILEHGHPYPALVSSRIEQRYRHYSREDGPSYTNIIYASITPQDSPQAFRGGSRFRVNTGVDTSATRDPGWWETEGVVYCDKPTAGEVVIHVDGKYWFAQRE